MTKFWSDAFSTGGRSTFCTSMVKLSVAVWLYGLAAWIVTVKEPDWV